MRWVKFDTSVNGIFSREVCPEDSEYLQAHMDTFKCMWHEQTRNYWVRMIVSLREYVRKHIFTYESLERLGAPVPVFEVIIEYAYINICTNFAEDSFGKAREFLRAVISVCANKDMMCQIGARPLSNDPFYNKFTRDYYRTVFGQPSSTLKLQLQTYIATPLYARFAAGVIALIKQWVQATDCSLKDFYTKFHTHPYWTYPGDYCPQKVLFRYIRDKFYGWESPDCQEVEEVMKRAPDRETAFAEVVELLPPDYADYNDIELSDCSSEGSADSFSPSGIKLWGDIVFGVSDDLISGAPFHVKELCATCMGEPSSDCSSDEEFDEEFLLDPKAGEVCDGVKYDYKFWRHPKVVALLDAAEKRFRDRLLDKLTGEAVVEESFYSSNKTVPPQRKGKKSGKKPRDVVSISINLTASAPARQPAFMKNGAVPLATSRPEMIHLEQESTRSAQLTAAFERLKVKIGSNETPPTGSSQQQAGNTSSAPKPQEAAKRPRKASNSQEGTKSQDAAKVPDKPSSKETEDKLASGDAAASKAVGPSKKVNKKPLVNGDVAVSNEAGPSKKIDKKPLVNGDVSKEAGPSKKVDKPLVNGGTAVSKEVGPSKKVDKKRLVNGDAALSKEVGPSKKVDKLLVNGDAAVSKPAVRKCATCGKSEGVKLKKCSLCVQKQMDPAYYCSRECQMEDWDDHQAVHIDDTD